MEQIRSGFVWFRLEKGGKDLFFFFVHRSNALFCECVILLIVSRERMCHFFVGKVLFQLCVATDRFNQRNE